MLSKRFTRRETTTVHLKTTAKKLNLPDGMDFRSFRTMHASLMRRMGRLEISRDNMGHAGGTGSITLDVYSKSWAGGPGKKLMVAHSSPIVA